MACKPPIWTRKRNFRARLGPQEEPDRMEGAVEVLGLEGFIVIVRLCQINDIFVLSLGTKDIGGTATLDAPRRGLGATARSPQGEPGRMEGATEALGLEGLLVIICS